MYNEINGNLANFPRGKIRSEIRLVASDIVHSTVIFGLHRVIFA